jgi:hypothetical protein
MSDHSSLPPDLSELIACERELPAGTDDDRRRIGIRLGATLGLGAAVGGTATTAAAAATSAAAGTAVKIIAIVLAIGAIGGGTALLVRRGNEPATSELDRPPASKPSAQVLPPAPVPEPPAAAETPNRASTSSAPPPAMVPSAPRPQAGPDQRTLLGRALTALESGRPSEALGLVDQDERLHASGPLAEEREAIRIEALIGLGRTEDARTRAKRFSELYPTSVHRFSIDGARSIP